MNALWRAVAPTQGVPSWSVAFRGPTEPTCFSARLPSEDEGLWFTAEFELTLHVTARGQRERQRAVSSACMAVLEFAREETRHYSVADSGLAETELWNKLLHEEVITEPGIRSGAVTVRLTVSDEDVELVRGRERCAPRSAVQAEEHRSRMQHLQRLTQDVYSDPAVTLRWWYDQHPDRTNELATAAQQLRMVHASEYEASGGSHQVESAGPLVGDFLRGLDSSSRQSVLQRLALLFSGFGRRDLAKRLRETEDDEGGNDQSH